MEVRGGHPPIRLRSDKSQRFQLKHEAARLFNATNENRNASNSEPGPDSGSGLSLSSFCLLPSSLDLSGTGMDEEIRNSKELIGAQKAQNKWEIGVFGAFGHTAKKKRTNNAPPLNLNGMKFDDALRKMLKSLPPPTGKKSKRQPSPKS
jgi:hypothetical protein